MGAAWDSSQGGQLSIPSPAGGWNLPCSPSPVRVVEVVGVADDAEGVVEVALDEAAAGAVRECAFQVLGACSNTKYSPSH